MTAFAPNGSVSGMTFGQSRMLQCGQRRSKPTMSMPLTGHGHEENTEFERAGDPCSERALLPYARPSRNFVGHAIACDSGDGSPGYDAGRR